MYRLLCLGLAFGLLILPSLAVSQDKKAAQPEPDLKVEGKLVEDDPKDKVTKNPSKVYDYKMKAKSVYVIDLKSKDFDCLLRLEDAAGKQLALNDDVGPKDLDSRIIFQAKKDGTYKIVATCYDGKTGDFTLTVRPGSEEDIKKADPFYELVGKPAADIVGEFSLNGQTKKLSDLKGKVVLVDFWAVWCGPCIATFPHLIEWDKQYKKDGLEIVGVTTYYEGLGFDKDKGKVKPLGKDKDDKQIKLTRGEEHDMIKDFIGYHKLSHRILVVTKDNQGKASKDFLVRGIPEAVLIDRKGIIRMVRVGSGEANATDLEAEIKVLLAEKK